MIKGEIQHRIRMTSDKGLIDWLEANEKEVSHPYYRDNEFMKNNIEEESNFIRMELKQRIRKKGE